MRHVCMRLIDTLESILKTAKAALADDKTVFARVGDREIPGHRKLPFTIEYDGPICYM